MSMWRTFLPCLGAVLDWVLAHALANVLFMH